MSFINQKVVIWSKPYITFSVELYTNKMKVLTICWHYKSENRWSWWFLYTWLVSNRLLLMGAYLHQFQPKLNPIKKNIPGVNLFWLIKEENILWSLVSLHSISMYHFLLLKLLKVELEANRHDVIDAQWQCYFLFPKRFACNVII